MISAQIPNQCHPFNESSESSWQMVAQLLFHPSRWIGRRCISGTCYRDFCTGGPRFHIDIQGSPGVLGQDKHQNNRKIPPRFTGIPQLCVEHMWPKLAFSKNEPKTIMSKMITLFLSKLWSHQTHTFAKQPDTFLVYFRSLLPCAGTCACLQRCVCCEIYYLPLLGR